MSWESSPRGAIQTNQRRSEGAPVFVALGLGGNLGDARAVLAAAAEQLATALEHPRLAAFYRSTPLSAIAQPLFLNTVIVGWTRLAPDELLAFAKRLEQRAGRAAGPRGGPRPLDIDLLLYGDLVVNTPELTLPHPRLRRRRFVLAPLAEVAPGLRLPPDDRPVSELLAAVGQESQVERLG